ncbi:helix-turn-helix transcriptional regulator [Paenibacillus guangzhouensis]|uniref:helix-turn-helix transcriptional regulator n=1 Tax=Paenibacillus guangzhouensis TaxID=1473112 RepID=UPI0012668E1D|nr:response regulator transcription factor [Paenibacillus guangzhouensis]
MKLLARFPSRKYLQRILLTLIIFVVVVLCVFSLTMYWNMKNTTLHIQSEANRKVLAQVKYNVEYMDEILKNLMMSLYFDNEVIPILNGKDYTYDDIAFKLAKLDKLADSSTYLHSIMLYNAYTDSYLSTNRKIQDNLHGEIQRFEREIDNRLNHQKMKLIPIKITDNSPLSAIDFFSYMMYDKQTNPSEQSKLILNVKPEWIFNNIKVINDLAYDKSSSVLLMDGRGKMYTNENQLSNFLPTPIMERIQSGKAEFEYFTYGSGKDKSIVTVLSLGVYNWKAVSIQSYDYAFRELNGFRNMLIVWTIAFLLLSAVIAYVISARLYRPVETMLNKVRGTVPLELKPFRKKDEWSYLSASYASIMDKANSAELHRFRNRKIIEEFHIRNLLTKSKSLTTEKFRQLLAEHRLPIDGEGPFIIGVCKIDKFEQKMAQASADEQRIYRFALGNIAEEMLSKFCKLAWVEMGENQFVFLASFHGKTISVSSIEGSIKGMQQVIRSYYQLSTTISFVSPFESYRDMENAYTEAQNLMQYRMLLGSSTLITSELVKAEERHEDLLQATHIEKQIIEHLRTGNSEGLVKDFNDFFNYAANLTYTQFMNAVLLMTVTVTRIISEVNENLLRPIEIDVRQFYQEVLKQETADEIKDLFLSLAAQFSDQSNIGDIEKNDILCRTIKAMIAENSMDPDFSLQSIARLLKMSSAYIGRQFKQYSGISVTEYINDVRLDKALELLETKDITINEVMELSGYRSQSYFFKLFKSKYGTSPKNYRLRKAITATKA